MDFKEAAKNFLAARAQFVAANLLEVSFWCMVAAGVALLISKL